MVRFLSGLALAILVVALIWLLSPVQLLVVALVVAGLAFGEYARLVARIGARVPWWSTLLATLAACAMVPFPWVAVESVLAVALAAVAVMVMSSARSGPDVLHDTAAAVLAPVYLGLPLGALVGVLALEGREAVLLLLATVVVSDSAQFYAGRAFGRRPLAPRLSPKKTIEGAVGGFLVAPAMLAAAGAYVVPSASPLLLAALGVVLVAAGICGDLFESMLKRAAGVKDSSALIPGHGGVLDRIDALLFAAPLFYLFLRAT
jgi:phosphatidate cytidylyltransferase